MDDAKCQEAVQDRDGRLLVHILGLGRLMLRLGLVVLFFEEIQVHVWRVLVHQTAVCFSHVCICAELWRWVAAVMLEENAAMWRAVARARTSAWLTVVSSVTGCDVTTCATTLHASSRHEAVSDSRGVPRCTEKIHKIYARSHVSIIRLVHFTIRSACNSSLSLVTVVPVARRTRLAKLCPHTQHRSQFVESFTSQRSRPDVFGFTSVLTDDIVSSFRNTKS